jgi:hypothetical protein
MGKIMCVCVCVCVFVCVHNIEKQKKGKMGKMR